MDISFSGIRSGEKLYEEVCFGHEQVTPTSHPKVLRSPAEPVDAAMADKIETLIRSALNAPDNRDRRRLIALASRFRAPRLRSLPAFPERCAGWCAQTALILFHAR